MENNIKTNQLITLTQSKMSNTQSKQPLVEDFVFFKDKLVLKIEEVSAFTDDVLMKCFVVYDHNEHEYFVCGKRQKVKFSANPGPEDFKFYCESRENVIAFLRYTFMDDMTPGDSTLTHVLYNFKHLDEQDYVDYWTLEAQEDPNLAISGFNGATFSKKWLSPLLKMLKYVRY